MQGASVEIPREVDQVGFHRKCRLTKRHVRADVDCCGRGRGPTGWSGVAAVDDDLSCIDAGSRQERGDVRQIGCGEAERSPPLCALDHRAADPIRSCEERRGATNLAGSNQTPNA